MSNPSHRRSSRASCADAPRKKRLRILVVYKKTCYMEVLEKNDRRTLALIRAGHESANRILPTHHEHEATMTAVKQELQSHPIDFKVIPRELMAHELGTGDWDIVATVGGDGTCLEAAHYMKDGVALLGILSASSSHGHYCLANISNLGSILDEIISGKRKPLSMMRLRCWLDGKPIEPLVMNEVWVTDSEKGSAARYILHINSRSIAQKSDGIVIGPPGGTTAMMRSYGGEILPITSRRFEYVVQGLIVQKRGDRCFTQGLLNKRDMVRVVSQMSTGQLQVDGRFNKYEFPRGSELIVKPSQHDLLIFADPEMNDRYKGLDDTTIVPAPSTTDKVAAAKARKRWHKLKD